MEKESGGGLFTGLLVGAIIGIGLGLLYAPRTGRETRDMLRQQAEDLKCRTKELGDELKEGAEDFGDLVREKVSLASHAVKGNGSGRTEA